MKKQIAVLGLGNPLMCDEGIGCFLISHLREKSEKYPDIDFIDCGTGGMALLHLIAGRRKVILIDCALMGTEPGTIKKFTPEDVISIKKMVHQSLHEADIIKILEMAKQLGEYPQEVVIFGIEPEEITQKQQLTRTISQKINHFIKEISREFQAAGD